MTEYLWVVLACVPSLSFCFSWAYFVFFSFFSFFFLFFFFLFLLILACSFRPGNSVSINCFAHLPIITLAILSCDYHEKILSRFYKSLPTSWNCHSTLSDENNYETREYENTTPYFLKLLNVLASVDTDQQSSTTDLFLTDIFVAWH